MRVLITISLGVCLFTSSIFAQRIITGTVMLDGEGEAIGANVVVEGNQTIGTTTEFDGTFSLDVPADAKALVISYTGFDTQTVSIEKTDNITVTLLMEAEIIEEAVVIGHLLSEKAASLSITPSNTNPRGNNNFRLGKKAKNKENAFMNGSAGTDPIGTEEYAALPSNSYILAKQEPLTTFSADVDNASYSNVRRWLMTNEALPPVGAVRIEEMLNYFNYDYQGPKDEKPFSVNSELGTCPWNKEHQLLRIGIKGYEVERMSSPYLNMVFLIDVSGSMDDNNKLGLVKRSLNLLVDQMRFEDQISIVTYSDKINLELSPTPGSDKAKIKETIQGLVASGGTAGGRGIQLAYETAQKNFIKDGNNRIVLCTDGDFNIGISSPEELETFISEKKESGIFLSVLGFGMGNYKDNRLETLADKGNGNYAYIDNFDEARTTLVEKMTSNMITIAKDVKFQVAFNPEYVAAYRLVGYENRVMDNQDFDDDQKDAGEIGAGHTVTALYEIIPKGINDKDLPKEKKRAKTRDSGLNANQLALVKLRYKQPDEEQSNLTEHTVSPGIQGKASEDFSFQTAVAAWGMWLKDSPFMGETDFDLILDLADQGTASGTDKYKEEFKQLVRKSKKLSEGVRMNAGR